MHEMYAKAAQSRVLHCDRACKPFKQLEADLRFVNELILSANNSGNLMKWGQWYRGFFLKGLFDNNAALVKQFGSIHD